MASSAGHGHSATRDAQTGEQPLASDLDLEQDQEQIREDARLTRRSLLGLGLTLLVVVALFALLLSRLISASQAAGSVSATPLEGHPAPAFTIQVYNPATGAPKSITLASLHGHPVVVNFFASWCEPCQEEAPLLAQAEARYAQQGVVFLGVAYQDKAADTLAFLKKYGVPYPTGPDTTGEISVSYAVTGVPETVFISKSGVVNYKWGGMLDQNTLNTHVQAILR